MITLRTGSHALNIITLLSVTGEFPMRSLKILGNERVLKALVHKMTTPQDYRLPHTQNSFDSRYWEDPFVHQDDIVAKLILPKK